LVGVAFLALTNGQLERIFGGHGKPKSNQTKPTIRPCHHPPYFKIIVRPARAM
jgi:hypothetical protein